MKRTRALPAGLSRTPPASCQAPGGVLVMAAVGARVSAVRGVAALERGTAEAEGVDHVQSAE
ncbi:MAG: hypothetical protein HY907_20580 [Deltaproteobacteria bacterium]|nr:hypothetical protein [Deltaproteobacteria bacterium]